MNTFLPVSWRARPAGLLPADASDYAGPESARWTTMAYLALITARGLVHLFAPDGGAHSVATLHTAGADGGNIIGLFGQWGSIQLLLAALLWVLILRYRGLTPLALGVLLTEPFVRGLAEHLKPINTFGAAAGSSLNWVVVPVIALILYLSLCPAEQREGSLSAARAR